MKRALIALFVLAAAGAGATSWTHHTSQDVPCFTVAKASFARHVTADGNLRAATVTQITVPQNDALPGMLQIAWLALDGSAVKAGDPIARFDRAFAEKQLRDAQADLTSSEAYLRQQQLEVEDRRIDHESAARYAAQEAEQARAQQDTDPVLFSRRQILESALDEQLASARRTVAERTRDLDRKIAQADIALSALERDSRKRYVERARTALDSLEVRSPGDGVLVLRRDDHGDVIKPGAKLWGGESIGELPVPGTMEAELFVLEIDASGLDAGQAADVVVDSHPDVTFYGKIKTVDKVAKARDAGVPVQYVSVVIALDATDTAIMKPGQRVHATIVLDRQDAIVVPRQAVFDKDGKTFVYRRGAHDFEPAAVELGAATPGRVAITSGLYPGDAIALRDPAQGAP